MSSTLSVAFESASQYAVASGDPPGPKKLGTDLFSLFGWANAQNSNRYLFGKWEAATSRGYLVGVTSNGNVIVYISNGAGTRIAVQTVGTFLKGASTSLESGWRHVGFTYDGSETAAGVTIYVDASPCDVDVVSDTLAGTIDHTINFQVSGYNGISGSWLGNIDEVTLWNAELTPAEVAAVYSGGDPADPRVVGPFSKLGSYWPMGELDTFPTLRDRGGGFPALATGASILDRSQNSNNGTPTNMEDADFTTDTPGGLSRYSATLDGVNEYVNWGTTADYAFERTDSFSFSWWMKCSGVPAADEFLLTRKGAGTPAGYQMLVQPDGDLAVLLANTTGSNEIQITVTASLRDGAWHHVVVAYGGTSAASDVDVWIDNVPQTPTINSDTLSASIVSATASLLFGTRSEDLLQYYTGQVDEIAIYNKKLTTSDVAAIWNSGAPTDNTRLGTEPNLVGYWGMGETYIDLTMTSMVAGDIEAIVPEAITLVDLDIPNFSDVVLVGGAGTSFLYKMRGVDDGRPPPGYVSWVVSQPDFLGTEAPAKAEPPLIGSIVPGSVVLTAAWTG